MPNPNASLAELLAEADFFKSSRSDSSGGSCVEAATNLAESHNAVLVRDSKNRGGGVLVFTPAEWDAFVGGVRDGEFDLNRG